MIRFPSVSWPESKLVTTRVGIPRHLITAKSIENLLWVVDPGTLRIPGLGALGPGKSFIWHFQDQAGAVWGSGFMLLSTSLPTFLGSSPWAHRQDFMQRLLVTLISTARANRNSSKLRVLLPGLAGWDRHTSFGKTQWPD